MGRAPCCDKANVKKGPWSPEEDAKLKSFIEQNGTGGNWITLPSKAGLKRCGKSCRLRWINYLRPDIKHGSFTEEEEKTIYRLHAQIGSRWSLIAAQLPGRTDNDIKNYWNTRLKKKLLERSNAASVHYGRLNPYQQIPVHLLNQLGLQDQMASAAAREGLFHGQHSYQHSYYLQQYQQQQYLQQQMQVHQHHQLVHDPSTVHLPTVLQHQMNMRSIKNETLVVDEHHHHQQPTLVAPTNGAVEEAERERQLMVIESSLRSYIVSDEGPIGDDSGNSGRQPVNNMGAVHPMRGRVVNAMSPLAVAAHHNVSSPTSSCSNLSSDRNSFGVQQVSSPVSPPGSLLATPRFDVGLLFCDDLSVDNRPQGLSEILTVVDRAMKDDFQTSSGGGHGAGSGEWWNLDPVSSPRINIKWPIPTTPRCGAGNITQTQLASQSHSPQPDGIYTDSY